LYKKLSNIQDAAMSLNSLVHSYSFAGIGSGSSCVPSNVSLEWLIMKPHILLWADNIYITNESFEHLVNGFEEDRVRQESINMVLDEFKKERVINLFDPNQYCKPALQYMIWNQVDEDKKRWGNRDVKFDPETGKGDLNNICIGNTKVCPTILSSIYFGMALARRLDSGCLFDSHILNICSQRFNEIEANTYSSPFVDVFGMIVPEVQALGDYVVHKACNTCANEEKCKSECLQQTEIMIGNLMDFRIRDEMKQTKDAIKKAIQLARNKSQDDPDMILKEFNKEVLECKKRMLDTLPKVNRWVQITAMLSAPLIYLGTNYSDCLVSSMPEIGATGLITKVGGAGLAASIAMDRSLSYLKSKYQWVNFLDELKQFNAKSKKSSNN
jgi:hypothetical protein